MKNKRRSYAFPRILNTFVLHAGHSPFAAFIPFFIITSFEFFISTSFLHFMHLPFGIKITPEFNLIDDKNTQGIYKYFEIGQNRVKSRKKEELCVYKYPVFLHS